MTTQLQLLRDIKASHERLVNLADELDWDGLSKEWQDTEPQFSTLTKSPLSGLNTQDKAEASALIKAILQMQEQISGRVKPWMEHVHPLLESFARHPIPHEKT